MWFKAIVQNLQFFCVLLLSNNLHQLCYHCRPWRMDPIWFLFLGRSQINNIDVANIWRLVLRLNLFKTTKKDRNISWVNLGATHLSLSWLKRLCIFNVIQIHINTIQELSIWHGTFVLWIWRPILSIKHFQLTLLSHIWWGSIFACRFNWVKCKQPPLDASSFH